MTNVRILHIGVGAIYNRIFRVDADLLVKKQTHTIDFDFRGFTCGLGIFENENILFSFVSFVRGVNGRCDEFLLLAIELPLCFRARYTIVAVSKAMKAIPPVMTAIHMNGNPFFVSEIVEAMTLASTV